MECSACGHEQDRGWFCGRCGARVSPVPAGDSDLDGGDVQLGSDLAASGGRQGSRAVEPTGRDGRPMVGALVVVCTVVLGGLGVWQLVEEGPAPTTGAGAEGAAREPIGEPSSSAMPTPAAPPPATVGSEQDRWPLPFDDTGTVLLFDDGRSGGVVLDVDTGRSVGVDLPGQRPGDQPFRLWRMGGRVVVGWGEVVAVDVGGDRPARLLGEATVFLPAAERDQLWLVDYRSGRTAGPSTWTLIDAAGQTLRQVDGNVGQPLRGVPGGLALRRADGSLARYDAEGGEVTDYLDDEAHWILDATRDRVLWCDEPCHRLRVSDPAGQTLATFGDPGDTFSPAAAWLSRDAARLAATATVEVDGGRAVDRRIRVYDVADEHRVADAQLPLGRVQGSWTWDGDQFFYWLDATPIAEGGPTEIGHWAAGGRFEQADVAPHGRSLHGFVTLPRAATIELFTQGPRAD